MVERIVVAGAGLAGLQTVVALRAQGYAGQLTLLGAEGCRRTTGRRCPSRC